MLLCIYFLGYFIEYLTPAWAAKLITQLNLLSLKTDVTLFSFAKSNL